MDFIQTNRIDAISPPTKVFQTSGNQPVLILCSDFNLYVCKYNRLPGRAATKLFHEWIAGCFAKLWNFATPDFSIVTINPRYALNHYILQPSFFTTPCFGSRHNRHLVEIDAFYAESRSLRRRQSKQKNEFLKIALFDIWLANEDRNFNNFNLLIDVQKDHWFIPIDHDSIFNTGNLDKGLVLLSENETLLYTNLTRKLFSEKELCDQFTLKEIKNEYYLCVRECENNLKEILQNVPEEWKINIEEYENLLITNLFEKKWIDNCWRYFLELLQHSRS